MMKPINKGELFKLLDYLPDDADIYLSVPGSHTYLLGNVESDPSAGGKASAHLEAQAATYVARVADIMT